MLPALAEFFIIITLVIYKQISQIVSDSDVSGMRSVSLEKVPVRIFYAEWLRRPVFAQVPYRLNENEMRKLASVEKSC